MRGGPTERTSAPGTRVTSSGVNTGARDAVLAVTSPFGSGDQLMACTRCLILLAPGACVRACELQMCAVPPETPRRLSSIHVPSGPARPRPAEPNRPLVFRLARGRLHLL